MGNPNARGGFLFIDDEKNGDLRFRVLGGDGGLPGAPLSDEKLVAHGGDERSRRIAPFFHERTRTLYYSVMSKSLNTRALTGSEPANPAEWGPAQTIVQVDTSTALGRIFAISEPSVADRPDASRELYFIDVTVTPTGVNPNLGRVRSR